MPHTDVSDAPIVILGSFRLSEEECLRPQLTDRESCKLLLTMAERGIKGSGKSELGILLELCGFIV